MSTLGHKTVREHADDTHDNYRLLMQAEQEYVEACADYDDVSVRWQEMHDVMNAAARTKERAATLYREAFEQVHGCKMPGEPR